MTCRCGGQFCWNCAGKWSPQGHPVSIMPGSIREWRQSCSAPHIQATRVAIAAACIAVVPFILPIAMVKAGVAGSQYARTALQDWKHDRKINNERKSMIRALRVRQADCSHYYTKEEPERCFFCGLSHHHRQPSGPCANHAHHYTKGNPLVCAACYHVRWNLSNVIDPSDWHTCGHYYANGSMTCYFCHEVRPQETAAA
eukprot:Colp12_sorted_trinity150504_noHs@36395